jgi:GT2 family glycosyltransferase
VNVSVCVIFRNSEKTLPELIRSFQYLPYSTHQFEFIFVDNNSTDQSLNLIKNSGLDHCKIIPRDHNSLAEARNQALQNSQFNYIYFIDSDCSLNPNTWDELLKNWNPTSYDGWGGSQIFPKSIPFLKILDQMRYHYLGHFGSAQMKLGTNPTQVDHLSTTHVLYKKEMLIQLGGFNPRLASSAEDLELSLRIHKAGFKLQFLPSSQVNHLICENIGGWLKKAWRNGVWQTRLVSVNSSIINSRRFWPPVVLFMLLLLTPKLFLLFITIYSVSIIFISFSNIRLTFEERLQLFILFTTTHGIYFVSGLTGLVLAIQDLTFSRNAPD